MVDVDGVLIHGRPEDGRHWQASLEKDLGLSPERLQQEFFLPDWENILLGRAALMDQLAPALQKIAPHVSPEDFVSYWLRQDSRLDLELLNEICLIRSAGRRVYLATNQEHVRAAYLLEELGLSGVTDGICYSARLGARKPEAAFFAKASSCTPFDPGELLLIDDNLQNIHAALAAGWKALHWTAGSSPEAIRTALGQER